MLEENQMYRISLDDYTYPRYMPTLNHYFGTREQMLVLATSMSSNESVRERYAETIEGIDRYELDHDLTHTMAGKELTVLNPVEEVCSQKFYVDAPEWYYPGFSGAVCLVKAKRALVDLALFQEKNSLHLALKASFEGLRIAVPGMGWQHRSTWVKGFPGMVIYNGDVISMRMYIEDREYKLNEQDKALRYMENWEDYNLALACADILGEI